VHCLDNQPLPAVAAAAAAASAHAASSALQALSLLEGGGRRRAHVQSASWPIARPLREALRLHSSAMRAWYTFREAPGRGGFILVVVVDFVMAYIKIGVIHIS